MKLPPGIELRDGRWQWIEAGASPGDVIAVVCPNLSLPLSLRDNATGPCSDCGQALQFRPDHHPSLRKLCYRCAAGRQLVG